MAAQKSHGWGAYFWPILSFLGLIEIGRRMPDEWAAWLLPLKVIVPAALVIHYARNGAYPELRGYDKGVSGALIDFAVGLLGGAIWMAPYLVLPDWRPEEGGFDADLLGPSLAWLALSLRAIGYGFVTPFVEELFVRSWLARYVDVYDKPLDFRDVPIARYSLRSLIVVVVWFTLSHLPWEYPVAVAWILLTQAWFYYRKHLMSLVIVHAGSNLGIFVAVLLGTGRLADPNGAPIDLWFFI